jgi:hypothetical protein
MLRQEIDTLSFALDLILDLQKEMPFVKIEMVLAFFSQVGQSIIGLY